MSGPTPEPDLTTATSSQVLEEMGETIKGSRKYFNSVCTGIGDQAEGPLAYMYSFTLTRDEEAGFWDKVFGSSTPSFTYAIINDEDHEIWIPKDGDIMPPDWAWHVDGHYSKKPISNVQKRLSPMAEHIKKQLEGARSDSDGIANMQSADFDAIGVIPTALGKQNRQLESLSNNLNQSKGDAQKLKQDILKGWNSDASRIYADLIGDFKTGLSDLNLASLQMKTANITVATHVNDLMVAIMELWKARIEGMDQQAASVLGGAKDLVGLLKNPTPMAVLSKVMGIVIDVLKKMATKDVSDRIEKLKNLGDMARKLDPIEQAESKANAVKWPDMHVDGAWVPR